MHALRSAGIAITIAACAPAAPAPSEPPVASGAQSAVSSSSASPASSAPAASVEAVPHVGREGSVYLAVRGTGIVRLDAGGGAKVVHATPKESVDLVLSPGGALFASFWDEGTIRIRNGKVEAIAKTTYHRIAPRSDDDVFATPDPFRWSIDHYDGKQWKTLGKREDFRGRYDDNKLDGIAVTKDAVWISTWNGLFRGAGSRWEGVSLPPSEKAPARLFSARDHVIGWFQSGYLEWDGSSWTALSWPNDRAIDAVSGDGIAVGSVGADPRVIRIGELGERAPTFTTPPTRVPLIDSVAIDGSHRAWVVGGSTLVVVGPKGTVLTELGPGTVAGVTGRIDRVAVEEGGPLELPAQATPKLLKIRGMVQLYKTGKPLGGASVQLCASSVRCEDGWHRATTTRTDGSFVLDEAPPTELTLRVEVPAGLSECESPFTAGGLRGVDVARDCASAKDGLCDIGIVRACVPFEMPPRR